MRIKHVENEELSMRIYHAFREAGFDDCGIIGLEDMSGFVASAKERIRNVPASEGLYGLAINHTERLRETFPWAKSIVIASTWLGKYRFPEALRGRYSKGFFASRNSDKSGPEYREKCKIGRWFDENHIRWTGEIREGGQQIWGLRHAAAVAGLGIIRRNNFLYCEEGSWLELDSYLIDRHCRLYQEKQIKPCPEKCTACRGACPTGALCGANTLNPNHCVSLITTFGRGMIPEGLEEQQLGQWIAGCEACQDACPFNRRHDWNSGKEFPGLDALVPRMSPENIASTEDEDFLRHLCDLTCDHILPDQTETLRVNARRALSNSAR